VVACIGFRPPPRYGAGHGDDFERLPGRRMRLLELVDLADMLRRVREPEADALSVRAGRETPALDRRNLVRHAGMRGIVGDGVDAGLRHDLARLVFLRHGGPPIKLIHDF
jgi:hypothetical protein